MKIEDLNNNRIYFTRKGPGKWEYNIPHDEEQHSGCLCIVGNDEMDIPWEKEFEHMVQIIISNINNND